MLWIYVLLSLKLTIYVLTVESHISTHNLQNKDPFVYTTTWSFEQTTTEQFRQMQLPSCGHRLRYKSVQIGFLIPYFASSVFSLLINPCVNTVCSWFRVEPSRSFSFLVFYLLKSANNSIALPDFILHFWITVFLCSFYSYVQLFRYISGFFKLWVMISLFIARFFLNVQFLFPYFSEIYCKILCSLKFYWGHSPGLMESEFAIRAYFSRSRPFQYYLSLI